MRGAARAGLMLVAAAQAEIGVWGLLAAGAAFLAATLPHFAYHVVTADKLSTGDDVASLGGFALEVAVVSAAMMVATRSRRPEAHRPEIDSQPVAELRGAR